MDEHIKKIEAAIAAGYNLPALSPIAMEAVEMASQDGIPASNLAAVIERDPALAARLIKLANSAFFKTGNPVSTLTQAIVKIGFDRVRMMALSISLRDTFPMGKRGAMDYEKFWKLSLYRGLIAKALASRFRRVHPEEAFVAALLGEIGLLVFFDLFIRDRVEDAPLEFDNLEELLSWERGNFGVDHREVGKYVLSRWSFPQRIVLCQDAGLKRSPSGAKDPLLSVCDAAAIMARMLTTDKADLTTSISCAADEVSLSTDEINKILSSVLDEVEEIGEQLKIKVDHEKDVVALLEKANSALMVISQRLSACPIETDRELPTIDTLNGSPRSANEVLQAVVHEIRNPLMVVGGFVRKLAKSLPSESEGNRYVQVILEEASRLEKIMGEMNRRIENKG